MERYPQMLLDHLKNQEPEVYKEMLKESGLQGVREFCRTRGNQASREKESLTKAGFMENEADEIVIKDLLTIP